MFKPGDRVRIHPTFTRTFDGMIGTVVGKGSFEWDCAIQFDGDPPGSFFHFNFAELEALDGPW